MRCMLSAGAYELLLLAAEQEKKKDPDPKNKQAPIPLNKSSGTRLCKCGRTISANKTLCKDCSIAIVADFHNEKFYGIDYYDIYGGTCLVNGVEIHEVWRVIVQHNGLGIVESYDIFGNNSTPRLAVDVPRDQWPADTYESENEGVLSKVYTGVVEIRRRDGTPARIAQITTEDMQPSKMLATGAQCTPVNP